MDERRDDWRQGVDENLASLNTGQRVNDRLIEDLEIAVDKLGGLIHGTDTSGILGRLEAVEHTLAELRAVVIMDASGRTGLQHDVQELKEGRLDRRMTLGNVTKILVAAIMSGLLTHFWHNISVFWNKQPTDAIESAIEKARNPKPKHRHIIVKEPPEDPAQ